jgi:hypothetical protein
MCRRSWRVDGRCGRRHPQYRAGDPAAHAVEAVVAFKYVRRYPGALAVSVLLTLLFGLLHILPLARQSSAR